MLQGGFIQGPQSIDGGVGVRGRLKVGQESIDLVTQLEPPDSLVDLFDHFRSSGPPAGAETAVVAEHATPGGDRSIDIGTGHACIDAHVLNALPELLAQIEVIGKVPQA